MAGQMSVWATYVDQSLRAILMPILQKKPVERICYIHMFGSIFHISSIEGDPVTFPSYMSLYPQSAGLRNKTSPFPQPLPPRYRVSTNTLGQPLIAKQIAFSGRKTNDYNYLSIQNALKTTSCGYYFSGWQTGSFITFKVSDTRLDSSLIIYIGMLHLDISCRGHH